MDDNKSIKTDVIEPLVKWAGGKRRLLKYLLPLVPMRVNRYFEPFLGGGALFFALEPEKALLSDKNADLINLYQQVKNHPDWLINSLRRLHNSEKEYYRVRDFKPRTNVTKAARVLYLTKFSFNGIYRLNVKGQFNVPYGHKNHIPVCEPDKILQTSKALQNVRLRCADFEEAVSKALCGDLVYLDPPYTVAHGNNGFIKYNAKIFSWDDQVRLAKVAARLADKGCTVLISNADHDSIHGLYRNFRCMTVKRASVMAASSEFRGHITECIFYHSDALTH